MRSHLLSVAALALLSVFVVVSTPCLAQEESGGNYSQTDPTQLPPNSDPSQITATPDAGADPAASIEDTVEPEDVPESVE